MYLKIIKPSLDFFGSLFLFVVTFPAFFLTFLLLAIVNNGKVFFIQKRPGKNEKIFKLIKFRTMNERRDEDGNLLEDNVRLTTVGKWVRKVSFDELPQLINVMKGDMSLIGPRPLLIEYLPLYNNHQRLRHKVKPGISGWAQINGRNAITWEEKFNYDVWYVNNINFLLDARIALMTIVKIIKAEGINTISGKTMENFKGNNK